MNDMPHPDSTAQLAILHTIARKLSSSVHLEQMLQITLSQVAELLALETGWIFLLDGQARFYLAAAQNLPPGLEEQGRMSGWCQCQEMFRHDELHRGQNISVVACSRLNSIQDPVKTGGLRFHASIPLLAGSQKLGVLNAASRQRQALSRDELHTLYTIGDLLSLAIQRTRYYEEHLAHSALSERYRLARELHDSLGQSLAALILRLETLDALVEKRAEPEAIRPRIRESADLARTALREARATVKHLRSEQSPDLGSALAQLVADLGLKARLEIEPGLPLSPALSHSLWRMLQELLTNIHKHAEAGSLCVSLARAPGGLHLCVSDDGKGFEPEAVPAGRFGLRGLQERVALLNGDVSVMSRPGAGTRISIFLPCGIEESAEPGASQTDSGEKPAERN